MSDDDPLDEQADKPDGDSGESAGWQLRESAREAAGRAAEKCRAAGAWVRAVVTWGRVKLFVGTVTLIATAVGAVYGTYWLTDSAVDTTAYTILFGLAFCLIPLLINMLGASTPGGAGLGKFHFILGSFVADRPYLVQIGDRYELCAGDEEGYWLDGEWHDLDGGFTNRTILGWRPFGFHWQKRDADVEEWRADRALSDGGQDVQRGGVTAAPPGVEQLDGKIECDGCGELVAAESNLCGYCGDPIPLEAASPDPDGWVLDLHRLYGRGLEQIGNTDLLETAEEQAKRDEVATGRVSEWSRVIAGLGGPIIGFAMGYLIFFV